MVGWGGRVRAVAGVCGLAVHLALPPSVSVGRLYSQRAGGPWALSISLGFWGPVARQRVPLRGGLVPGGSLGSSPEAAGRDP